MKISILFFACAISLASCQTVKVCHSEVRAGFDIGSGATKMKVLQTNSCSAGQEIILLVSDVRVNYRDDLEKNRSKNFSSEIQRVGLDSLLKLKSAALEKGATRFQGVATAAFRMAENGETFANILTQNTGIPVQVISQKEEALLAYQAVSRKRILKTPFVLWDIGGGSQQMVFKDTKGKMHFYFGELASVNFKNYVIQKIQKKNSQKIHSPNPMTSLDYKKSFLYASEVAGKTVPIGIRDAVNADIGNIPVVGVGGVLTKSILNQLRPGEAVNRDNISRAASDRFSLTDAQHKDAFADTNETNLILVLGFMDRLWFYTYEPLEISLLDGLDF